MPRVTVYIVRHAETEYNAAGYIQGRKDIELNTTGRLQARAIAVRLAETPIHFAFTSPLKRAHETAAEIVKYHENVKLEAVDLLTERSFGVYDGTPGGSVEPALLHEASEPTDVFVRRCTDFWKNTIVPLAQRPAESFPFFESTASGDDRVINVLVVSHGAWISGLLRFTLATELEYRGRIQARGDQFNTALSVVNVDSGGESGEIVKSGDMFHLVDREFLKRAGLLKEA